MAASPLASTARRLEVATAPNLTTIAADVASPSAPTRGDSDQPRPSLATVARQPNAEPAAVRSQPNLDAPAASTTTQIGRPASRPLQPGDSPSIAPDASPAATVARATTRASVAASPENVESPAVAETSRGVGSPNAEPARMALSKALTGMAGIGQGRNLDRAQPAADSPALITSAAARRAQATQENPPGPALSPQASALVRRAAAGNQTPTASQQAQADAETALVAGAPQPDQLAASASAALTRADAAAPTGPVTGTTGVTEVDLGPSRAVSEGQVGRGSGGGQPTLNFETDSPRIARSDNVGGAPQAALASPAAAEIPTAPPATAGSQPGTLVALDAKTGQQLWQAEDEVLGTMLIYSRPHDLLLMCYQATRFKLPSEVGGRMAVYRASSGQRLWANEAKYETRPLLQAGTIIAYPSAVDLLTGESRPLEFVKSYGCGQLSGSKNLLLFRSATLGYYDFTRQAGTENYGGVRPGCWVNALPVGGLVLLPDATAGCKCSYQNRTWMALEGREYD